MKKNVLIAFSFLIATISFAQKKELKAAEKALRDNNYAEAKAALAQVQPLLSSMDNKLKSQYHLLNAQALYAGGSASQAEMSTAIENLKMVGSDNADEAMELTTQMENSVLTSANNMYKQGKYAVASEKFATLYQIKPQDTVYLYYAASSAVSGQDLDLALKHYLKLKDLGYKGVETEYFAINKETGKEEVMTKSQRDLFLRSGDYIKPGERVTESKLPEITKNIAIIYMQNKETDKAITALKEARAISPDNVDLIITEANLYFQLDETDKFTELMKDAVARQPNNASLHYNIGVMNMKNNNLEEARNSFKKALELDPSMSDAALNISTSYIDQGNALVEEMNSLGTTAADNRKYDELKDKKTSFFEEGAKVLENHIKENPDASLNIYEQLRNIYNALGDLEKAKAIKAKMDSMQN
jgi:tetratricopeptide (TPR) repeat protein